MKSLMQRFRRNDSAGEFIPAPGNAREQAAQADGVPTASGNYRRYTLIGTTVLLVGFGGFLLWSALAPLASAVISNGQVVVEGYRTTLQHLEGGIIEELHVEEGQQVEQGDVLVEFDGAQARSDLAVVESRLLSALGQRARLRAERDGDSTIDFPADLTEADDSEKAAEIMANQRAIFNARRQALETDLSLRAQRIEEFEQQIRGLEARLTAVDSQIASFTEEVEEWSGLVEDQLSDKQSLRDARRRLDEYRGQRGQLVSDIAGIRAQIASTRMERSLRQEEYDQEVASRLGEVQGRLLDARARVSALRDKLSRTVVSAPTDGSVVGLKVHSQGSVVSPGEALMDIVPRQRRLLVDARVPPDKIDDVRVGQATDLSFPALNTIFINNIQGDVVSISADALTDEQNNESYYLARIRVNAAGVAELRSENFQLEPGMPVQAFIKTGSRSLLAYLVKPFSEMASRAFREG
jgi:epimerase transport system membrane fusion protein